MEALNLTWGGNFKTITDQGILEGSGIVFGSENEPDASYFKDFFTENTYVNPEDSFTTTLFMEHCFSYDKPIGKAHMYKTAKGWEVTAELNMEDPVIKARFSEIKDGNWGFSTGAVSHAVIREKKDNGTHHIKQWAVGEISITKTPAEPKALIRSVKSLDEYYAPYSIEEPDLIEEEETDENDMQDKLMEIIRVLVEQIAKKEIENVLKSELDEIKNLILNNKGNSLDVNSEEIIEELTVLKSVHGELLTTFTELQSSFNEKEALLSEKMALLSETQADNEAKASNLEQLEEALKENNIKIETLQKTLDTQREVNRILVEKQIN